MQSEPRGEANSGMTAGRVVVLLLFATVACGGLAIAANALLLPGSGNAIVVRPTELPLAPPTLSANDVRYVSLLGEATVEHRTASGMVRGLLTKVKNNETLLDDENWPKQIVVWLEVVRVTDQRMRDLVAPPRFSNCQDSVLSAVDLYDLVVSTTEIGVDERDSHTIEMAIRLLDFGDQSLQEAMDCVKQVSR